MSIRDEIQQILTSPKTDLTTPKGQAQFAADITKPARLFLAKNSLARKIFLVEQLPEGAMPYYHHDPALPVYFISETGEEIESEMGAKDRFMVPLFEIAAAPMLKMRPVPSTDAIADAFTTGLYDILNREEQLALSLLAACENRIGTQSGQITLEDIRKAIEKINQADFAVEHVVLNPDDFKSIFGRNAFEKSDREYLPQKNQQESPIKILVSSFQDSGTAYVICEKEFSGRIPIRIELTGISCEMLPHWGISFFEDGGMALHNPKGVIAISTAKKSKFTPSWGVPNVYKKAGKLNLTPPNTVYPQTANLPPVIAGKADDVDSVFKTMKEHTCSDTYFSCADNPMERMIGYVCWGCEQHYYITIKALKELEGSKSKWADVRFDTVEARERFIAALNNVRAENRNS